MDPEREEEVLLNVACGLDPLTAIVAAGDDEKPPTSRGSGCVSAVIAIGVIVWALI
jgi:hypothetical protein